MSKCSISKLKTGWAKEARHGASAGISLFHIIYTLLQVPLLELDSDCQRHAGTAKTKTVLTENNHLRGLRHKHLTYVDSAFMYICKIKNLCLENSWRKREKDSNFTNKVRLQGANVSHMVFSPTHWPLGPFCSFSWFLLNSSYGFFLWEGLASLFIAACKKKIKNKIVIRIEGICRGLLISGICSSG